MHKVLHSNLVVIVLLAVATPVVAQPKCPWLVLPPIPSLPHAQRSGMAPVNGMHMWYAVFGHGKPVILVHGGLANANWWGLQVPALVKQHYRVIVLDSRGQGHSTRGNAAMSYHLMATDVLGLMDYLHIHKAALVGWSDGAIIGLDIAVHNPDRLTKLFAFGANSQPSGMKDSSERTAAQNAVVAEYSRLMKSGYEKMSPTPGNFITFHPEMTHLWKTEPNFTSAQLQSIRVPTWIVDGDHDEIIKRSDADYLFSEIPGAEELILPGVSHFAFLQNPGESNAAILHFLKWQPEK
jgi:pimeloyl-ACP methyl ester carboxylesterase